MPEEPQKFNSAGSHDDDHREQIGNGYPSLVSDEVHPEVAAVSAAEPSAVTPDHPPRPWLSNDKPRKKKGPIIAGIIAATLVIVGCGGWAAYAYWYQNPEKIVMDAIVNAMTAKTVAVEGTITASSESESLAIKMNASAGYKEGASGTVQMTVKSTKDNTEYALDASGVSSSSGTGYIKINNLKNTYTQLLDQLLTAEDESSAKELRTFYGTLLKPVVDKIDGKWVKFSATDLKHVNPSAGEEYECTQNAFDKLAKDGGMLSEVGNVYRQHAYIKLNGSLGTKAGSVGYLLSFDDAALKQFMQELKNTEFYKELQSCSNQVERLFDEDADIDTNVKDSRFEVWIDQWSHQLTGISSSGQTEEKGQKHHYAFDLSTKFNSGVQIVVPQDTVSFNDIVSVLTESFGGLFQLGTNSKASGTI